MNDLQDDHLTRLTLHLERDAFHQLMLNAIERRMTISDLVHQLVRRHLPPLWNAPVPTLSNEPSSEQSSSMNNPLNLA